MKFQKSKKHFGSNQKIECRYYPKLTLSTPRNSKPMSLPSSLCVKKSVVFTISLNISDWDEKSSRSVILYARGNKPPALPPFRGGKQGTFIFQVSAIFVTRAGHLIPTLNLNKASKIPSECKTARELASCRTNVSYAHASLPPILRVFPPLRCPDASMRCPAAYSTHSKRQCVVSTTSFHLNWTVHRPSTLRYFTQFRSYNIKVTKWIFALKFGSCGYGSENKFEFSR